MRQPYRATIFCAFVDVKRLPAGPVLPGRSPARGTCLRELSPLVTDCAIRLPVKNFVNHWKMSRPLKSAMSLTWRVLEIDPVGYQRKYNCIAIGLNARADDRSSFFSVIYKCQFSVAAIARWHNFCSIERIGFRQTDRTPDNPYVMLIVTKGDDNEIDEPSGAINQ